MQAAQTESVSSKPPVDFLWLELTNRCNLQCIHCYADSGPQAEKGTLSTADYVRLMTEAFSLGCRRVQFIGGEPTLNRGLPELIRTASEMGFEFIEIYTNLTILPQELLQCFVEYRVHVATSVYGPAGERHDAITLVDGSFEKTIRNLRRIMAAGLPVRASIIQMEANAAYTDSTVAFLREIGVRNVTVGGIRRIGRGAAACESSEMSELCGNCAGSTLCVSPTGMVSPCIMSKKWSVGSIADASLSDIATGDSLRETRQRIYDAVVSRQGGAGCMPAFSNRHASCAPSYNAAVGGAAGDPSRSTAAINVGAGGAPARDAIGANKACLPTGFGSVAADAARAFNAIGVDVPGSPGDCSPSFASIGATAPCQPTAFMNVGAECLPSAHAIGSSAACGPNSVLNIGHDCAPTFNAIAAAPCSPTGVLNANANCSPAFSSVATSLPCQPSLAPGVDCSPAFSAIAARAACAPQIASGVTRIGPDCQPAFSAVAAPACGPSFAPGITNIGADCAPAFDAVLARPACGPSAEAAVSKHSPRALSS